MRESGEVQVMQKQCVICGQLFTPYLPTRQRTCSPECRKTDQLNYRHSDIYKQKRKAQYRKKHVALCRICGRPIDCTKLSRPVHMHDECLFDECKRTLNAGKRLSELQRNRLASRGYTITEFREAIEDSLV